MNIYKQFLAENSLKQRELAEYLQITESAVSNLVTGKANLSEANLIKLLQNEKGWDVSMFPAQSPVLGPVDSVVNSKNFRYEKTGITAEDFLAIVKENQRQMGKLIETISILSGKIK